MVLQQDELSQQKTTDVLLLLQIIIKRQRQSFNLFYYQIYQINTTLNAKFKKIQKRYKKYILIIQKGEDLQHEMYSLVIR